MFAQELVPLEPLRTEANLIIDNFASVHRNVVAYGVILSKKWDFHDLKFSLCVEPEDNGKVKIWLNKIALNKYTHVDYEIVAVKGYGNDAERVLISKSDYSLEDEEKLGLKVLEFGGLLANDGSLHLGCFVKIVTFNLNADIQKKYKELFEQERYSDYKIHVIGETENEVEVINVHKNILSCYDIFRGKFRREPTQNHMRISNSSPQAVRCFLLYLYCGHIEIDLWDRYCWEILMLADEFVIENLRNNAESYLASKIANTGVIIELCRVLDTIDLDAIEFPIILDACRRFIEEHPEKVDNDFWAEIRTWPTVFGLLGGR